MSGGATMKRKGALVNGRAPQIMPKIVMEIGDEVSQDAYRLIVRRFNQVLQNPTGYYVSNIHVISSGDEAVITDGGVIYGPWLEGVSRRNAASRFKGYSTFRMVSQEMAKRAAKNVKNTVAQKLKRLE